MSIPSDMYIALAILILGAVAAFAIGFAMNREVKPACTCDRPGGRLLSDGQYECKACTERRLSGRAPKGE